MRMRRAIGFVFMGMGALALLTPLASWVAQRREQEMLLARFERQAPGVSAPSPAVEAPGASELTAAPTEPSGAPPVSRPAGSYRIEIPAAAIRYMVQEGIADLPLGLGPGHYPNTPLPGDAGNAGIAGHRTVKGMPSFFYKLDSLNPGDTIVVTYPDRTLTFAVERVFLTSPYDMSVLNPTPGPSLTLTTCDPPGLADRRLIVQARLVNAGSPPADKRTPL
jgi:sortase A